MMKAKDVNNKAGVTAYIKQLDQPIAAFVEAIRQIILNTDSAIGEQIKWNSPSFFYTGTMQPFDPKEYKRDIVVMNLRAKDHILLVLPTGAKLNDTTGLLEGNYTDGRSLIKIYNTDDLQVKTVLLQDILRKWLGMVEK